MAQPQLRLYHGPQDDSAELDRPSLPIRQHVTVPLSEVLPLLADAVNCERMWLRDFDDDPISISTDLYEMLLAYQHFRRPSA